MKITILFSLFFLQTLSLRAASFLESTKWELHSQKEGISVFISEGSLKDSDSVPIRLKAVLNHPLSKVLTVLVESERKKEWIPRAKFAKTVESNFPKEGIEYIQYEAPWPVKDRDFLIKYGAVFRPSTDTIKIKLASTTHSSIPKNDNHVRGVTHEGLITLKDRGTKTDFEMAFVTDFRGSVPTWIINMVQKKWPYRFVKQLNEQLEKEDVIIKDEVKDLARLKKTLTPNSRHEI